MPVSVEAKGKNGGDLGAFCSALQASIDYISGSSLSDEIKAALLAPLESANATYCPIN
jgi:hypothetical protein